MKNRIVVKTVFNILTKIGAGFRSFVVEQLELDAAEYAELRRIVRRRKTSQRLAQRARIVLLAAEGVSDVAIAEKLDTTRETVGRWRRRFLAERMDGLYDEPRPGAPRKITDDVVEEIVVKTLESTPKGSTHWSNRSTT